MRDRLIALLLCFLTLAAASQAAAPPAPGKGAGAGIVDLSPLLSGAGLSEPSAVAAALRGQLPARASDALESGLALQGEADRLADALAGSTSVADVLAKAAAQAGIEPSQAPEPVRFGSFAQAVPALGATAGIEVQPADQLALTQFDRTFPEPLARPILDLVGAMVTAASMRGEALRELTATDVETLGEQLAVMLEGGATDDAALADVAGRIDLGTLVSAADLVARAAEDAAREIQENIGLWPDSSPSSIGVGPLPLPPVPVGATPAALYIGPPCDPPYTFPMLFNIPSILDIGSFAPNTFGTDVILSIDPGPGGQPGDCYTNNAGATNAAVPYPTAAGVFFPVAAAIDLAGNDVYHSSNDPISDAAVPYPAAPPFSVQADSFIQGAAFLGIGLLLDVGGDDRYASDMNLDPCPFGDFSLGDVGYDFSFLQGAAYAGVGLMADLEGADHYNSYNRLHQCEGETLGDDVDYTVRFAQGAGALGLGVLLDAGTPDSDADDAYNSANFLWADRMDVWPVGLGNALYLVDHTQGSAGFQGVGAMVETNEDALYNSLNQLLATPNPATLQFAPQSSSSFDVHCSQGTAGRCEAFVGPICIDPADSEFIDVQDICIDIARQGLLTDSNVLGVLVDALGDDKYNCGNQVQGTLDFRTGIPASYSAWVVQGVVAGTANAPVGPIGGFITIPIPPRLILPSVDLGVGVHADLDGDDCYNSSNFVQGFDALLDVRLAQGVAHGLGAVGVLTDRARDDVYNCSNGLFARASTDLLFDFVQGNGGGFGVAGVHVDTTSPQGQSGDCYNSFNSQSSGEPGDLTIHFSQGTAAGSQQVQLPPTTFGTPPIDIPVAIGVLVDTDSPYQDPMPSRDFFNSYNTGMGFGLLDIWVAQGAVADAAPGGPPTVGGAGVMVEVGSNNTYNYENTAYAPGRCAFTCHLEVALGSATNLFDIGAFVDVSLQPCSIFEITNSLGLPNVAPVCFGAIGPDHYGGPLSATPVFYPPPFVDTVGCWDGNGGLGVALDLYDGWGAWPTIVGPVPPPLPTNTLPPPFAYPDPAPWGGFDSVLLGLAFEGTLCLDE